MTIHLQTLRSSSSGNSLLLWTDRTTLMIDCGIHAQYTCEDLLTRHVSRSRTLDGVIVSHAHGDHICYAALRVLDRYHIPIHCHGDTIDQVHAKHVRNWASPPRLREYSSQPFAMGDFELDPIEVNHAPGYLTFGFVIRAGHRKIVIATDLNEPGDIAEHLVDADVILLEANHDLELLRQHWNPSSLYHLNNPAAARLLVEARTKSRRRPEAVLLSHLSDKRNTEELALETVRGEFARAGVDLDFHLNVAPKYAASTTITLE